MFDFMGKGQIFISTRNEIQNDGRVAEAKGKSQITIWTKICALKSMFEICNFFTFLTPHNFWQTESDLRFEDSPLVSELSVKAVICGLYESAIHTHQVKFTAPDIDGGRKLLLSL